MVEVSIVSSTGLGFGKSGEAGTLSSSRVLPDVLSELAAPHVSLLILVTIAFSIMVPY